MYWLKRLDASIVVIPRAILRAYTTFQLGGRCRALVFCETSVQLRHVVAILAELGEPYRLIGGGSNLLISDDGLDEIVVRYASNTPEFRREGDTLRVSGATGFDDLAAFAAHEGLDGLVFANGIPGTVGGAVAGNAGAFGEQISDRLISAMLMDRKGRWREAEGSELGFAYRASALQQTGDAVLSVRLQLNLRDRGELRAERERVLALRRARHPDWKTTPCAGSFFKNIEPTSAAERRQAAGWFLEQVGAKTMQIGGARVFEKHANILIKATPDCTANDVHRLARILAGAVKERFKLELVPEVQCLGKFGGE